MANELRNQTGARKRWIAVTASAVVLVAAVIGGCSTGAKSSEASTQDSKSGAAQSGGAQSGAAESLDSAAPATTIASTAVAADSSMAYDSAASAAMPEASREMPGSDAASASQSVAAGATDTKSVKVAAPDRDIIYTGNLTIKVGDILSKTAEAKSIASGVGGWVADEQSSFGEASSTVLTFRVPPAKFDAAMTALTKLGTPSERRISTSDVTGVITDLEGRVKTLEVSITRLRGFLDKATDPNQIAMLESELLRRETELESINGQKADIEGQVSEATIVLTLQNKQAAKESTVKEHKDGFSDGLRRGWNAFTKAVNGLFVGLGAVLPFLILAFVVALIWRAIVRRNRKRQTTSPSSPVATAPEPTVPAPAAEQHTSAPGRSND